MTVTLYDIARAVETYVEDKITTTAGNPLLGKTIKFDDKSVKNLDKLNDYVRIDVLGESVFGGRTTGRLGSAIFQVTYRAKDNKKTSKAQLYLGSDFLTDILDNANFIVPGSTTVIRVMSVEALKINHQDGYRSIVHRCECQFIT